MQAAGDTKTAKFPTKLRRNYPRSRNGCLTCRHRKKKCDEVKPDCTGCTRNRLSCVWPPTTAKPAASPSAASATTTSAPAPASGTAPTPAPAPPPTCHSGTLPSAGFTHCARHPSNLSLYQHKSRWQTYLPALAAWEGVEGCSVNLNPAYDESGRRTDVDVAAAVSVEANDKEAQDQNINDSSNTNDINDINDTNDESESAHPVSSSHTDADDTASTTVEEGDDGGYDLDDNEDGMADDDDDDEDAIVASWSPSVASFVVDPVVVPPPPVPSFSRYSRYKSPLDTWSPSSPSASSPYAFSSSQRQQRRQQNQNQNQNHSQNHSQNRHQHKQQRRQRPSIPRMPSQRPRVAAMTPLSSSMLRHYIVEASPTLATNRTARNPYIAAILPLAYTDDLVMHCVLAIGGAHLSNRLTKPVSSTWNIGTSSSSSSTSANAMNTPASSLTALTTYSTPDKATAALHDATTRHYTCVLRSLRGALRDLQPTDSTQVLRVLAVLLLLSTYECLSWNVLDGGVFAHLRAGRQLIAWLRDSGGTSSSKSSGRTPTQRLSSDERSLLGALLEIYAYQVLANRICPDGMINNRSAVGEDMGSHDDEDFVADPGLLADQDGFGLLFSGLHGLFALIPPMARLGAAALNPAANETPPLSDLSGIIGGSASAPASMSISAQVTALRNRALSWQLPAAFLTQATGDQERIWQRAIGETYRHGVLIYLETIKGPGETTDLAAVQRHIIAIGEAVIGADLVASRFATILLWPLLITGSVMVHADERMFLAEGLRASPQATWASIKAADVLEKMWARRDVALTTPPPAGGRRYYGPIGLAEIMLDAKVNLSVG
ncbi:c6 transcription factor [Ophiostoma piceae UAMH 11346]|uniref:C6 transcription factor n=1 Tax=Ophiostoma piceae (strain UAMH 11346) TaxID=1262450 RepID=S3C1S7_OPHP1|nr:c6 transcription factor [Ophiostoma piceae UAMH 11346]